MTVRFEGLTTETVRALQRGGPDAYGQVPETRISDGDGVPCRHCLTDIPEGEPYLVLAHRPFVSVQPYAETGPIFLHASECERSATRDALPAMLSSPDYIIRGYDDREQIVYGTGEVVPTSEIIPRAEQILSDSRIVFVHVRSARNNCFQCRIDRE